jgi:RuvB-like protein 2
MRYVNEIIKIQDGHIAGRALLIVGEPGTGKTALAMGISKSIGDDTPFVSISASEVYSMVKKYKRLIKYDLFQLLLRVMQKLELANKNVPKRPFGLVGIGKHIIIIKKN